MILSASGIQEFLTCKHKYWLNRVRRIESKKRPRAFEFGAQIHKAADVLHENWDAGAAYKKFCENYEDMPHDQKRTRVTAERMIRNYRDKYKDQPFKVLHTGFKFKLSVPEIPGWYIIGEIDRIIDWFGRKMIDELKTTSQLTADYMHRFWVDYQTTIYLIAARKLVDPTINAVLADACLVSKTDPSKLKSEPFMRDIIERTPDDLEYYRLRIVQILFDIKYCLDNNDAQPWYENDQSCTNYGGCQYLASCKEPWNMRERVLAVDYQLRAPSGRDYKDAKEGEFMV